MASAHQATWACPIMPHEEANVPFVPDRLARITSLKCEASEAERAPPSKTDPAKLAQIASNRCSYIGANSSTPWPARRSLP